MFLFGDASFDAGGALVRFIMGMGMLTLYIGLPVWFFYRRAVKKKQKEEYERKLLLQNPEAWERVQRLESEKAERNRDRTAGAAKAGLGLALRLLKK